VTALLRSMTARTRKMRDEFAEFERYFHSGYPIRYICSDFLNKISIIIKDTGRSENPENRWIKKPIQPSSTTITRFFRLFGTGFNIERPKKSMFRQRYGRFKWPKLGTVCQSSKNLYTKSYSKILTHNPKMTFLINISLKVAKIKISRTSLCR